MRALSASLLIVALAVPALADQHNEAAARRKQRVRDRVPEGVKLVQDIEYARVGEKVLLLDLYLPQRAEPTPRLIVWIHGGGWRGGSKERATYSWLAQAGYAVASINYRLSGVAKFPAQIHDCKGAVRWLRANAQAYGYDASRVGVAGSSAGGHLVALLGTSAGVPELEGGTGGNLDQSSRVQAVVDLFGPADLATMPVADNPKRKKDAVSQLLGGHPSDKPDLARLASPVAYITPDDAPFLILHGARDQLVPLKQSELLDEKLDAAGVESDLRVLERAGHGGRGFNASRLRTEVLRFFDRHVNATTAAVVARASADATVIGTFARRGPHPFGVLAHTVLRDEVREKDLQVRVTFPRVVGPVPVVVWSHGAFGSKDRYGPLVEHWASHGYAVVQANHEDALVLTGGRPDRTKFRAWPQRPKDVAFLIDSLPELQSRLVDFPGTLDTTRVGVGGHSFGAHTAQLVGGVTTKTVPGGEHESHRDGRARAVLLLSGQGRGEALDETSWNAFTLPALVVTGTNDGSRRTGKPHTWRKEPYTYAPKGDKTFVLIRDAHHGFGGVTGSGRRGPAAGPENAAHVDAVRAVSLLFWATYLKGDLGAKMLLRSKRITQESGRAVRVQFK